ncbi:MAG: ABC transporter permease subunit [Spirochaetes bacterium]|jgi:phosphate transport system permease protein|nr:ABC transporter permease subunit [Spirochaetota bacterium]
MKGRIIEEKIFTLLMAFSSLAIFASLILLIGSVIFKGAPALDLAMVTEAPSGGFYLGKKGGVLNAILGSFFLAGGAVFISLVLSIPIVMYINHYSSKGSLLNTATRFSIDVLSGVPSIIFGVFGFSIMIILGIKASLLGGMITVAMLVLPVMCRAVDEVARLVPEELPESVHALGATRYDVIKVSLRQILPGILTAIMISFGRAIGDAASVLFTAGFTDEMPLSLLQPAATLPLSIFFQINSPVAEVQNRAYASALILTAVILSISLSVRIIASKMKKKVVK